MRTLGCIRREHPVCADDRSQKRCERSDFIRLDPDRDVWENDSGFDFVQREHLLLWVFSSIGLLPCPGERCAIDGQGNVPFIGGAG